MDYAPEIIKIKELDLDMIPPMTKNYKDPTQGGSTVVIIGKRNSGKSWIVRSLLYAKKHIFPVAMVINGTEDTKEFYSRILPDTFVHNEYDVKHIEKFLQRQKLAMKHLENPWAVLILDDCTNDPKVFRHPTQHAVFKVGRHRRLMSVYVLNYAKDIPPALRTNVDGVFIMREANMQNRKNIYENFCSVIPDFSLFCTIMDQLTTDHTALYVHNISRSNDWRDCVFWYKAKPVPDDFKFGCPEYYEFHNARYDENYTDIL